MQVQRCFLFLLPENKHDRTTSRRDHRDRSGDSGRSGCRLKLGTYQVCPQLRGALDRDGISFELDADGLLAVCIQHEMDHLAGKVFVDYLSPLKRELVRKN